MDIERQGWRPVSPVPQVNGTLEPILKIADSLRVAWEDALASSSEEERAEARNRRLRRHAVETGIIERLYEIDWATTDALVAEGISMEVANRAGGLSEDTLHTIRSQYAALEYLTELVRQGAGLTAQVIRELHQIITRNQDTYEARDSLGRTVRRPLRHGEWKQHPNHVRRPDGTVLEYTPPEHVQSELERLVELHRQAHDVHPLVHSAWLHHEFIKIHPFEDGNGRVARTLTLLVLLRERYAPLVVDRREREDYIRALDAANDGNLGDLIRFFAQLERAALMATLTQPVAAASTATDPTAVVREYAQRRRQFEEATLAERRAATERLAREVHARVAAFIYEQAGSLESELRKVDAGARARVTHAEPPDPRAKWWRRQTFRAANTIDFYANLADGAWWTRLQLDALGERLRFLAFVQKVGRGDSGLLAVTVYAELVHPESDELATAVEPEPALDLAPTDSVTLAHSDDSSLRAPEIEELLTSTLSQALLRFVDRLG